MQIAVIPYIIFQQLKFKAIPLQIFFPCVKIYYMSAN